MTTGIVELDDLTTEPNPIESYKHYTRYELDPEDRNRYSLGETEWFCTICGELVEDAGEPCWCSGK